MDQNDNKKYKAKAADSFKTKKNLFLFSLAIHRKREFSSLDFDRFEISNKLVKLYTSVYWQEYRTYEINEVSIEKIESSIKLLEEENRELLQSLKAAYINNFPSVFSEDDFMKLLSVKSCHYCKISTDQIELMGEKHMFNKKSFRGWSLEIDRKNSNFEYTEPNCVMACYWCNNAKTDEFTEEEFTPIGQAIEAVWKQRMEDLTYDF